MCTSRNLKLHNYQHEAIQIPQVLEQKVFNRSLNKGITVNSEKLAGLKFGESVNKSFWRKKVLADSPRFQLYSYGQILDWFLQLVNKVWQNSTFRQICQNLVPPIFVA